MSAELLAALVGISGLVGAAFGYWRYFEGRVASARDKADEVARDLASHRLHTAETYVTKSGMKEIKDEILGAVSGIRDDVRHLGTRIDAMHESQTKPRPRRAAGE
jgi:hypothetical protein